MSSLESRLAARDNSFDTLRLVAALMVVVSHAYHTAGKGADPWTRATGFKTLGGLGVAIFFIMSGFLVARSFEVDPSPLRFAWKRFLRIMPGLVVCGVLTVFVLGPSVTSLGTVEYFGHKSVYGYLARMLLLVKPPMTLPGVFTANPVPDAFNGSLWTLQYEVGLYALLMLCGMLGVLGNRWFVAGLCACFLVGHWHLADSPAVHRLGGTLGSVFYLGFLFFAGSLFWACREGIRLSARSALFAVAILGGALQTAFFPLVCLLTLPYLVIFAALSPSHPLLRTNKFGDWSYGVYIYAFPIQQTVAQYGVPRGWGLLPILVVSVVAILGIAAASWWFVEKPCLRLKRALW